MKKNYPAAPLHAIADGTTDEQAADIGFDISVHAGAGPAAPPAGLDLQHIGIVSADAMAPGGRVEVVFIEQNVTDLDGMLQAIGGGREVHVLDGARDGLQQMAQILSGRSGIDAIHLVTHGADASLSLGSLTLQADNTDAHAADLQAIGRSMTDGGDIMLYGCDVAAAPDGAAWLDRLAIVTGADVAASSNLTGSAELGGDWTLEVSSGKIDTPSVVAPDMAQLYHSVLAISQNVAFASTFASAGGYGASDDVIYNVQGNTAYQLQFDGAVGGVINFGGAYVIANYASIAAETAVTMSFQAGQLFTIGSIGLTNLGNQTTDQDLVFRGYDASNHLVATNTYTLVADITGAVSRSFAFTGMTEIATLKVTATTYGNTIKVLQINSLALSNIHGAVADTTPPVAPSTPALASGSDTGTSSSDNLTKTATPTFEGTAEANATVKLYDGATLVATTTANGSGAWSVATSALSQGVHSITATATDAANNLGPASSALSVTIDTTAPTLAITRSPSTLKSGETSTITFTFSEDPGSTFTWNGSAGDVTVTGGTLGALSGTGLTRTATFTPTASTNAGSASISVAASTYTDAAGNNGGAGSAATISYDTQAPAVSTPVLASASDSGISGSDAITNVVTPTLTGTAEAGATVRLYESDGTTLLGTTVATGGAWSIATGTLAAGAHAFKATATDAAGNVSALSSGLAVTIDTTAPTVAITSSVATLKAGETATITFTFSEDPGTGFAWNGSSGSVTVTGGTLGAISGTGTTRIATFTPTASTNAGTASISVAASAYTDKAGNAGGAGGAPALTFDTLAPAVSTPVLASASDNGVSGSDAITNVTTPTLTGTAEAGATVKLYDTDGTTLLGTTVATGGAWSIASSTLGAGAHTLRASATDAAGNVSALSSGLAVTIDTTAPTVAITGSVATLKAGETATITFTFSEDPGAGFAWDGSSGAVTVTGGTLGAISGTGTTRTATFTPTAGVDAGSASIAVAASAYTDKAGNAGGAGTAITLTYDTLAPTAPSTPDLADASDSGISNSDDITNITTPVFNGTGTAGDTVTLYDSNGTTVLGSTTVTGGGTWSITSSSLGSGIHQITARTSDAAGNVSASSALSVDIATAPPTLAITSSAATLHGGQSATITFTFSSDPGASFTWDGTSGDVVVTGGTLSAIAGSGLTRTATFTPTAGVNSGSASITVAAGTYTDAVSNSGGAGTTPSITFDTLAPTAPAAPALTGGSDSGTSSSDAITSVTTPTVTGTAEANSSVTLYDSNGTTALGTTTADGSGNWSITSSALAAGVHSLTARQTDAAGNVSTASPALSVTVDNVAPTAIALSATTASDVSAVAGATLATLSSTDTQTVSYSLVAGSAGNDASNALFTLVGGALKPIANLAVGIYHLYVSATDAAGNHAEQPLTFTVNSGPSASSIVRGDSVATLVATTATSLTYTVTFSEAVTGVDATDFTLTATGTASGTIAVAGSGSVYTVTVSALAGDGTLGLNLNGSGTGIQSGASAAITGGYTGQVLTLDHTAAAAPGGLAMTSGTDSGVSSSDGITSNATPVFTGTAEANSTVTLYDSNGSTALGTTTADGSGNWSITSSTLGAGAHSVTAKQADAAGNVSAASAPLPVTIMTAAPTVAITSDLAQLKIGQSASVTFTFSADPGNTFTWDGTAGDVVVTGGTLSAIAGTGLIRTATFTPTASVNGGTASISVTASSYTDAAGNTGGAGATPSLTYDTLAPSAPSVPDMTSGSDDGPSNTDNITGVFTPSFSGTAEAGATVRLYDTDGTTLLGSAVATGGNWTITSSALGAGNHTVKAIATDAAGNAGPASAALSLQILPAILPTVAIASDLAQLNIGHAALVTFTFSVDPDASFNAGSVTLTGGTLGAITGSGLVRSAVFTPTTGIDNGSAVITVAAGAYTDGGTLAGAGASLTLGVDTLAPLAASNLHLAAGSDSGVSGSDNLTNITTPTITGNAESGATVTLTDSDGVTVLGTTVAVNGAWSIASSALAHGAHGLTAQVRDAAGNAGPASAPLALTIDTQAPTVTISSDVTQLKVGASAIIVFQFSEDPGAGFTAASLTVTGGTLGALSGSGLVRAATFTPMPNVNAGSASITVAAGGFHDAAGNANMAATSPQLSYDTLAPVAPSAPALAPGSDSGVSSSDNLTNVTRPLFTGSAETGATVTLLDSDGVTVLGTTTAVNGAWSITSAALAHGVHNVSVIVRDAAGNASAASPALAVTISTEAPAAPAAPALAVASDSGTIGDGVTTVSSPVIIGSALANALVTLYDGATPLGTVRADAGGAWSFASPVLTAGLHVLSATQLDIAGNVSAAGASFNLSIASPPSTVDGVPVSQAPVILPGGGSGTAVEVPVILPGRDNSTGPAAVADIPLAVTPASGDGGSATVTLLLAQLPTGLGLSASGGVSAPAGDPLEHLIKAIVAATPNNAAADQSHLTDNGRNYLSKLPGTVPLLVETVTPTSDAGANGSATLTLTGTLSDIQHTALVIDTGHLGVGNSIVLQSVDFAAVIGAASVTGKTNGQILTGDAASQQFTVGAGLASAVFAGGGDDTLVFGLPQTQGGHALGAPVALAAAAPGVTLTTLHGGLAADTAAFAGAMADYKVELHDGYVIVSALTAPLQQAMLVNVETLRFGDASVAVQNRAELGTIAGLYQDVLGRQADVLGFEYWGNAQAKGGSLGQIALDMMRSPEGAPRHAALDGTAAHDVAILYQSIFGRVADAGGLAYWVDAMQNRQVTLVQVADGFMHSAEIVGHNKAAVAWDFQV